MCANVARTCRVDTCARTREPVHVWPFHLSRVSLFHCTITPSSAGPKYRFVRGSLVKETFTLIDDNRWNKGNRGDRFGLEKHSRPASM